MCHGRGPWWKWMGNLAGRGKAGSYLAAQVSVRAFEYRSLTGPEGSPAQNEVLCHRWNVPNLRVEEVSRETAENPSFMRKVR